MANADTRCSIWHDRLEVSPSLSHRSCGMGPCRLHVFIVLIAEAHWRPTSLKQRSFSEIGPLANLSVRSFSGLPEFWNSSSRRFTAKLCVAIGAPYARLQSLLSERMLRSGLAIVGWVLLPVVQTSGCFSRKNQCIRMSRAREECPSYGVFASLGQECPSYGPPSTSL